MFLASSHTTKTLAMPSKSTLPYATKQLDDTSGLTEVRGSSPGNWSPRPPEPSHGQEHDARESASRRPPAKSAAQNPSTPKGWITASRHHAKGALGNLVEETGTPRQRDHLANVFRRHELKRSSQAAEVLRPAPFTPGLYET